MNDPNVTTKPETPAGLSSSALLVCPGCGRETHTLNEGYCEYCREQNQAALDEQKP